MTQINPQWPRDDDELATHIRAFNWAGTPLGPIVAWSDRLKLMVEQVLAHPLISSLVCGPERVLIYNDAAAKLYGERHPAALGRPLPETFPEGWATVAPFYERAFAGETVQVAGQPLDTRGEGEATDMFDALLTPVRETDGHVAFVHMMGTEVSARAHVEATLRESEDRYRSLFHRMGQGYCELALLRDASGRAVDQRYIAFNPAFERLFGIPVIDAVGRTASEVFPGLENWWHEAFDRIAASGQPERIEHVVAALGRAFEVFVYPAGGDRLTVMYEDMTARRTADLALRASEERQVFLLKLSDALRAEPKADAIANRALKMLSDQLGLDRCYITYYRPADDAADVPYQLGNDTVPPLPAKVRLSDLPEAYEQVLDRTFIIEDDLERRGPSEAERANSEALGMRAMVASTIRRGERSPLCSMTAVSSSPRRWSPAEIALVEEAAERTWAALEHSRSEMLIRESEERLQQFGEASSDVLWIRDAETLQWIYLTPAFETIYGLGREAATSGDNMASWLDLIVPEDQQHALQAITRVRAGERVTFEYRIRRPGDGAVRWLRDTDFPMRDAAGRVCWIGGVGRDITEEKAAGIRQEVLVNELQHRARNLLGVVTAVADRTVKRGGSIEAFEERLQALSRAQALLSQAGSDTVEVGALVRAELAAYANGGSTRLTVSGPEVHLRARQVQNFALAVHELTTNALKYGALKIETGRLEVTWDIALDQRGHRRLALSWVERGVTIDPDQTTRRGYGTELIQEALAYAMEAEVDYMLGTDGVSCRIEMPLT